METTITQTVKGSTMEAIFDKCDTFSIRHYEAINLENEADYDSEQKYVFSMNIRHEEGTDAEQLLLKEINLRENSELQSLQNHVKSINLEGLEIREWNQHDKRRKIKKYIAIMSGITISPTLDYEQMNHFLLGFGRAVKYFF